jgi:hypothetical protein
MADRLAEPDRGNDTGGGWSISSWFGGDNSASESSGNPGDAGGGGAVPEAINAARRRTRSSIFDLPQEKLLDSF